jgi:glycosyltransferase involved in cell wall biosynthesis
MAMGVPVVAYRVDGTSEAIVSGETGYLCPPGALDEMASCCLGLLQDAPLRQRMAVSCRQFAVTEFDLTHMVAKIAELYEEQIKKKLKDRG